MSKKVFNVFSILCFALVLCFIGCTELINPKTETDINLNIDLSKIIKSTRNTEETQSSVSIGENPTIKVAIYDAKKYTANTNSTDNLDLITEAQAKIVNDEAKVKLNNIPVGIDAIVFAELSFSNGNSTEVMYAGNSEVFRVKLTDNKISLVLMKVGNSETYPDDTNTPYESYTLYKKTENGEEVSNNTEATISTSSTGETKVTVTSPQMSDSVWTYFVKPNNNTRFTESANYKVSVELKADKTTVVGIAAARADYFFTVNDTWTVCEFETGYLIGNENHQFTIGLGLSSEIEIKNLKIEKLVTTDTTEPSLVFDISKDAINSYLEQENRPGKIIEVSKDATNGSYNITINTPMCHSTGNSTGNSTGTDDSYIQDVKLHLRSYATEKTGANNVSFNITNNGDNDFETSVMADTASDKSISWNNNATKFSENNDGNFRVDFPNYKANDELIVDLITSSTSTSQNNSTSFTLSNFKVGNAGDSPFSDKIFAIQIDEVWTKIDDVASFSKEVKICAYKSINFDVLMFNNDAWHNENNSLDSNTACKEATRFVLDKDDIASDLAYKLIYSPSSNESGNPIYTLKNNSDEEITVQIKLNENYEVVIEEVTGTTITSWDNLKSQIEDLTNSNPTAEFVIADNLEATSTITVSKPVKITSDKNVTISRGNGSDGVNFEDSFFSVESAGNLELGSNENKIILDGEKVNSTNDGGAVYVSGGTFTMNNISIINCSTNVNGGAVYITNKGTFNMNGGTIDECFAADSGGGVWMNSGSSFTMFGDSRINKCKSNIEGGGVYVTDSSDPCTFKMLDSATITECSAGNGGGVCYYCDTDSTFEILENAEISKNIAHGNDGNGGGGIYLYGKLTMEGGTISDNEAPSGAGVYVRDGSSFTMNGGEIKNNKATQSSYSGIYVLGNIYITGGSICDNYACDNYEIETNYGASIYNPNSYEITILGQNFSANGGHFTKNIIDGKVEDVATSGGNESLIEGAYYVSANGNDSNYGLKAETPLLTLKSAIEKANNTASKTVYVIGELVGDEAYYSGFNISDDVGTKDSPINIIGYPDGIDDVLTVGDNRRVVYVYSNSYITFKDLTITGGNVDQSGSAMNLIDCTVTLDNVTIKDNSSSNGYTFGSNTYYSDGIEVGSNCTLNIIKSFITNNICVSGASNSPAKVTIGTGCDVSNIYLVSDSSTCTFDSDMKINGNVYICSTSANPPVPAIYLSSSLSNYSSDNRIMITYEDCSKVVNEQLISPKDGANFNLSEEVKKFTLSDTIYTISDDGKVVQNSGGE